MQVPEHLAIIMDGNGRWARSQGQERSYGHLKGAQTARKMIDECVRLKVRYLTLYTFSLENWLRPMTEVSFLMELLKEQLAKERTTLIENNVRFQCIGDLDRLPTPVLQEVADTIDITRNNTGMTLTFALSYGSRQEFIRAAKLIAEQAAKGDLNPDDINEQCFESFLQSSCVPAIDLLIRTSGEWRISNFLLWQLAYAEIYMTEVFWPDFTLEHLHEAFRAYQARERRFGQLPQQIQMPPSSPSSAEILTHP